MIQFQILNGKQAGRRWMARRFPVRIGRDAGNDLQLEADGVWGRHCELRLNPAAGYELIAQTDALLTVNHQPAREILLRNGDSIELGSARLRFWLADPTARVFRLREWLVWLLLAAILIGQLLLIRWLVQ